MKVLTKRFIAAGLALAAAFGGRAESPVVCKVELDNAYVLAGGRQKAVVKVTLDAPKAPLKNKRPPVNLAIVLDRSGSMSGSKLEKAREAAIEALRRLGPEDLFSLITYDDMATTVVPAQSAANTEWIEGRIRSIGPGGSTALFAGVSQGASEVRKHLDGRYVNRILLLSDGLANVGPETPAELGRLATAFRKEGISVTTMGIGTDYNEDLMVQMAQNSDGNTYFVESSVDLPRIFGTELGDVLSVVASKVSIEIEFPEGVRPVRIIGRDGRVGANRVDLNLNQLYGGQQKYALIEVELPEGADGEVRKVANARCSYQDMIENQPATSLGEANIRFTGNRETVVRNPNVDVGRAVFLNYAAEAQDQAVTQADNNDFDGAAITLYSNVFQLSEYAEKNGLVDDVLIQGQIKTMNENFEIIQDQQAIPSANRKGMRASSFQIYNQQQM